MLSRSARLFALVPLALLGCGAGNEAAPPAAPKPEAHAAADEGPSAEQAGAPKAPEKLEREALKVILPSGLPWLLRRVWPEEVFRESKFVGWRLAAIPEEWTGLDLRPDDVVTKINGKAVETPEQLWDAWAALATATELRVSYERGTDEKEIVLPIAGAPAPELFASLTNPSPPPRKPTAKRGTIVIEAREPLGDSAYGE